MVTAVVGAAEVKTVTGWLRRTWRGNGCKFSAGAIVATVVSSSLVAAVEVL